MGGILYVTGALADGSVTTAKLATDAVTNAKLADQAVTLDKLPHGTSSNDGKFLRANNGADPTFETVSGTTINNNADNRVITGSGTANTLNGEATLTYNGTDTFELQPASATPAIFIGDSNRSGAGQGLVQYKGNWNGTTVARITMDSGSDTTNKDDGIIRFDTAASGSVAERMRILAGGGLTFNGDTAAANALNDYEEGTFTPNWDAGGGVTFSYSQQHGWYTKIGNTVTFTLYLQGYASTITSGNGSNGVALQGLPFAIQNNNRYYPAFTIGRTYKFDINSDQRIYSYGSYGSTNARFIMETDDSTGNIMVADQLNQNTCELFLSGTYRI